MKSSLLISILFVSTLVAENNYSTKSNWLLDTKSDAMKFQKIQKQFRGFDLAMVEVGYRFNTLYFAIKDKNYDLAQYQLDKIKKAIENGMIRRSKRRKNSELMFLNNQYKGLTKALSSKDEKVIEQKLSYLKESCNTCHAAERVPFIQVTNPKYRWQPIK